MCIFKRCRFNCKNKNDHKIIYARMKTYYEVKNCKKIQTKSVKVNWEKYNSMFNQ